MNMESLFLSNNEEFKELEELVFATFNIKDKLPNQVFSDRFGGFKFGKRLLKLANIELIRRRQLKEGRSIRQLSKVLTCRDRHSEKCLNDI